MNKAYNPIDWKNEPNTSTPINETNLNKMDKAIDIIDDRVIDLDEKKANSNNTTLLGTTKFRSSSTYPYGFSIEQDSIAYATPTDSIEVNNFGVYLRELIGSAKAQYTKDGISMSKYGKTTTVEASGIVSGGDVENANGVSMDRLNNNLTQLEYSDVAGGKNLVDYSKCIKGYELDNNGNVSINANWYVTDFIKIDINKTYVSSGFSSTSKYYYDSSKNFISRNPSTVPSNAMYVRFNSLIEGYTKPQLEEGTTATDYEPYIPSVKMLADEVSAQNDSLDGLKNDLGGLRFGIDENGNYGYIKAGADTVTPFNSGGSSGMSYGSIDLSFKVKPYTLIEEDTTESGDQSGGIGGILAPTY